MSIGVYFSPESMSAAQYDDIISRLQAAGAGMPKGREYHCAFYEGDKLHVFDVWDTQENFEAFGKTLMPILSELGVNAGDPMFSPIHNVIKG